MANELAAAIQHECRLDPALHRLVQQTEPRPSSLGDLLETTLLCNCSAAIRRKCIDIVVAHGLLTNKATTLKTWAIALWEVHHHIKYSTPLRQWHAKRSEFQQEIEVMSIDMEICEDIVSVARTAK